MECDRECISGVVDDLERCCGDGGRRGVGDVIAVGGEKNVEGPRLGGVGVRVRD